jgi:hypothetical protein
VEEGFRDFDKLLLGSFSAWFVYFQKEQQHGKLPFSEQSVLDCFFESKVESFAGRVTIRQHSSRNVKERQGTSTKVKMFGMTVLAILKVAYRIAFWQNKKVKLLFLKCIGVVF